MDHYGNGYIKLILVSEDGKYIDYKDDEVLKKYVVAAQNIKPNTEMKYEYTKDENGEELEGLIDNQTIEEVVLFVQEVGGKRKEDIKLTDINISPDKYTWYVKDYVGRNLATCGYYSLGGDLRDRYGDATVKFVICTDDGTYVDVSNEEVLKNYVITGQSVAPNTEIKLGFMNDESGNEMGLVDSQNIEEIELQVTMLK